MAEIKFGTSQLGSPAPIGWRRFERAYIIGVIPAVIALLHGLQGIPPFWVQNGDIIIATSGSLIKAIGMFLGNGQEYTDTTKQ